MLSGNGRHRRPRQAPALLVAAGVTGSAIAIPLLGATGASAADGVTWDKVAECETGGSWSQNTGSGFYGGLHLSMEDWERYGGLEYAERPDLASRSQQIAVAEKVLADQGVGAWPACGLLSGLAQGSGAADVDTGVADDATAGATGSPGSPNSSDSSGTAGSSGSSASPETSASPGVPGSSGSSASPGSTASSGSSASPETSTTPGSAPTEGSAGTATDPEATPTADGSPDRAAQQPGGSPTAMPNHDEPDNSGQPVGSSSLVDTGALVGGAEGAGRHRGGSADEGPAGAGSTGRHAARTYGAGDSAGAYTVRAGDSLASIADSLDVEGGWRALYAENQDAIGPDPSHIVPGQTLRTGA
jgi:hypothetical protein